MVRVVFMGTPGFAIPALTALLETQEVVGVVTQPDRPAGRGRQPRPSPVKRLALEAGLPLVQPASLRRPEQAVIIREWAPDIVVVAAFGQILRRHLLDLPPHGCLNVHASLLPRWRGAAPIQHAILAGDEETGISLMHMERGLDTGPVFIQQATAILASDTASTLHDRLAELGAQMLRRHLDPIIDGSLTPRPQNDAVATLAPSITKDQGRLDWTLDALALDRQVRAMSPWPGAITSWEGKSIKILAAQPLADYKADQAGLVEWANGALLIHTGKGGLLVSELQLAGKKAMSADDFLRGRTGFIGSRLE